MTKSDDRLRDVTQLMESMGLSAEQIISVLTAIRNYATALIDEVFESLPEREA